MNPEPLLKTKKLAFVAAAFFVLFLATSLPAAQTDLIGIFGHSGNISAVAYSPDGSRIASAGWDRKIIIWDAETGLDLKTLTGHTDRILALAFSPDGERLLSGGCDKTLRLWDVASGKIIHTLEGHSGWVSAVSISGDGRRALSGGWDKNLILWDLTDGSKVRNFAGTRSLVNAVVFSPDGSGFFSGGGDKDVKLWDTESGLIRKRLRSRSSNVNALAVTGDGRYLLAGLEDGALSLWDLQTSELQAIGMKHEGPVFAVAFAPDGRSAVSCGADKTARIWAIPSGDSLGSFNLHDSVVSAVDFSPDGTRILTGDWNKSIKIWDPKTGHEVWSLSGAASGITALGASRNGELAVAGGPGGLLTVWDLKHGAKLADFRAHEGPVLCLAVSPDGALAASGGEDQTIKIWDLAACRPVRTLYGHSRPIKYLAFSPDGRKLLAGDEGGAAVLWNLDKPAVSRIFQNGGGAVTSLAFSPNGRLVLVGSIDGRIRLCDIQTGAEIRTVDGGDAAVTATAFSPNGQYWAAGDKNGLMRIRKTDQEIDAALLESDLGPIKALAFDREGRTLLAAGARGVLAPWNFGSQASPPTRPHQDLMESASFIPQTGSILTVDSDGGLSFRDFESWAVKARFWAFDNQEWVVHTPDGYYNASRQGAGLLGVRLPDLSVRLDGFFERFFSPPLVAQALNSPPRTGKAEINRDWQKPPSVQILSPSVANQPGDPNRTVVVRVRKNGAELREVRLFHNGALVQTAAPEDDQGSGEFKFKLKLVGGRNTIKAAALNADRLIGPEDEISLEFEGQGAKPDLNLVVIGINPAGKKDWNPALASLEAQSLKKILERRGRELYGKIRLTELVDARVRRSQVRSRLSNLQTKPEDVLLVYLFGPGESSTGEWKLRPPDQAVIPDVNSGDYFSTADLAEILPKISALKKLIIIDAQRIPSAGEPAFAGPEFNLALARLSRKVGGLVIAVSGPQNNSSSQAGVGRSLLPYSLLLGLEGRAGGGDALITASELGRYIKLVLPQLGERLGLDALQPIILEGGPDFALAAKP